MKQNSFPLFLLLLICSSPSFASDSKDECIEGSVNITVDLKSEIKPGGSLFIYLRELEREDGQPVAVITIVEPEYPQFFEICADDQMLPHASPRPLHSKYKAYARHSPSGVPMVKEGFIGNYSGPDGEGIRAGETTIITITRPLTD